MEEMYEIIDVHISAVTFTYKGKNCGVDPFSDTDFAVWYGEKDANMTSIEDVFHKPFFDGKSLTEIFPEIVESIGW